jgi:hypothetical protein
MLDTNTPCQEIDSRLRLILYVADIGFGYVSLVGDLRLGVEKRNDKHAL